MPKPHTLVRFSFSFFRTVVPLARLFKVCIFGYGDGYGTSFELSAVQIASSTVSIASLGRVN